MDDVGFEIQPQPDDTTCGPTCLQAVYRFFGDDLPLKQVINECLTRLKGHRRCADVGLLYDPARSFEANLCRQRRNALRQDRGELTVRRNYPYRGISDGLTTTLRRQFDDRQYAGIELEVSQQGVAGERRSWIQLQRLLTETLSKILDNPPSAH